MKTYNTTMYRFLLNSRLNKLRDTRDNMAIDISGLKFRLEQSPEGWANSKNGMIAQKHQRELSDAYTKIREAVSHMQVALNLLSGEE